MFNGVFLTRFKLISYYNLIMQLSDPDRLHSFDALRGIAMLFGIFVHIALCYSLSWSKFWVLQDNYQHIIFDIIILIVRACRMEIFFFMAGFFAHLMLNSKGDYYFIKNRFLKILIPFTIFEPLMLIFIPLSLQQSILNNNIYQFRPFHLWFLYYLIFIYISIYVFKIIKKLFFIDMHNKIITIFNNVFNSKYHIFILSFITLLSLITMKFIIIDTPSGFAIEYRLIIHYSIFFYLGWTVKHNSNILNIITNNKIYYLILAVPNIMFLIISMIKFNNNYSSNFLYAIIYVLMFKLCYAISIWCLSLSTIGFFQHYLNKENKLLKYLSAASYWMYIVHLPLIFFLQYNLSNFTIVGWLKPIIIFLITIIILLTSYYFITKINFLKYYFIIVSRSSS